MIDLDQDDDGDGIPNELRDALTVIIDLMKHDGYTDATRAALTDLTARLPYTAQTRVLQQQSDNLAAELMTTRDATRHQVILTQLEALEALKMQDPTYVRIVDAKRKVLVGEKPSIDESVRQKQKQTTPAQTGNTVFLPFVMKKSTGGVGAPPAGWTPFRGDVLLVDGSGKGWTDFLYQVWWGHSGMYDGDDLVYESIADGVWLQSFTDDWSTVGNKIWHGRTLNQNNQAKVVASLDAAKVKYGVAGTTPYNIIYVDKVTEEEFYCSQLVWRIHQGAGIDVDSNDSLYSDALIKKWAGRLDPIVVFAIALAAVAPDEIYLDSDMQVILEFTIK